MASRTVVELTDDLTGEDAAETVQFGLDGSRYEIDLTVQNAKNLRESLAPYIESGRQSFKSVPKSGGRSRSGSRSNRDENNEIREWARSQGIQIGDRGRIPEQVRSSYRAGH